MKIDLIKKENASEQIMSIMIWAIFGLFGTRLFLQLTSYPQIGNQSWHVAHVLWGGLAMTLGMVLNLTYNGSWIKKMSTIIFGLGLGFFVDESGKYLSRDNNYFFRPAIIFIYIFFIILFIFYRYLEKNKPKDPKYLLYSIFDQLAEIGTEKINKNQKISMLKDLKQITKIETNADQKQLAGELSLLIKSKKNKEGSYLNLWQRLINKSNYISYRVLKRKIVLIGLGIYVAWWSIDKISDAALILTSPQKVAVIEQFYVDYSFLNRTDVYMIGLKLIFDVIVAIFFISGLYNLIRKQRRAGFWFFQQGLIINIYLSSVFKFYFEQFSAVLGLILSILVLSGVNRLKKEIS
jgi:hypothetical protein